MALCELLENCNSVMYINCLWNDQHTRRSIAKQTARHFAWLPVAVVERVVVYTVKPSCFKESSSSLLVSSQISNQHLFSLQHGFSGFIHPA
ncbi:Altered inheritance of mitochondria protein 9 [Trichinella pseudospiralis]